MSIRYHILQVLQPAGCGIFRTPTWEARDIYSTCDCAFLHTSSLCHLLTSTWFPPARSVTIGNHGEIYCFLSLFVHPSQTDGPSRYFWQWTDFTSYLVFTTAFVLVSTMVTHLFGANALFVHLLGFAALFIEALLGLPQLIKNYQNGSTKGMSVMMVFLWTIGDVAKSVFFMLEHAPLQFPLCGWLQVTMDLVIFAQHFYYTYLKR
ncbi:unnamed protein product [Echinostoma caproni]|uniref:PQ-loop repeat-containing protein 1 n=1 Tax=Echinostoma caproni TaxID=27848 RepID=A0A3P8L0H0_9TREM|nr:unnamed protein product [Echinostoma caproni]